MFFKTWFMDRSFARKGVMLATGTTRLPVTAHNVLLVFQSKFQGSTHVLKGVTHSTNIKMVFVRNVRLIFKNKLQVQNFVKRNVTLILKETQQLAIAASAHLVLIRLVEILHSHICVFVI